MTKRVKLILRQQPTGAEATPWLDPQRERFAKAAREVAAELKDTKLKGAARIRAMNARISQKLKESD